MCVCCPCIDCTVLQTEGSYDMGFFWKRVRILEKVATVRKSLPDIEVTFMGWGGGGGLGKQALRILFCQRMGGKEGVRG